MKVMIRIILIVACVLVAPMSVSNAQTGTPQVTKLFEETSYYLKAVTFLDANTGWAVGDVHWDQAQRRYVGTVIKTVDGGATWAALDVGVTEALEALVFVDASLGWAVGANGTIIHTADGGQSWTQQPVDTTAEFMGVTFADANHGWAVTTTPTTYDDFFEEYTDWDAALWATSDGGQSWQQQMLPDDASILRDVDVVDAQTGWAVGVKRAGVDDFGDVEHAGVIYHSADGGATWTEQYSPTGVTLTAVDFVDALHGWAVGFPTNSGEDQRAVFHTSDGGQSWEIQEPGDMFTPLWDVQFIDQNRGYIVGTNYIGAWGPPVFRTFDGGTTWEAIRMKNANPLSVEGLYGVAVFGDQVFAVGDHDYVAVTAQAWDTPIESPTGMPCFDLDCLFEQRYLNPHYIFHSAYFIDENQGWVVGSKTFAVSHWGQVILHTQDGGLTWETQYEHSPDVEGLFSVHRLDDVMFSDALNGWVTGTSERVDIVAGDFNGAILTTTDGGQTWQDNAVTLYEDRQREFFAVDFIDAQNVWALAARNFPSSNVHLARTSDGGSTWAWVDAGVEGSMSVGFALVQGDIDFPDAEHGWAAGGMGVIVNTVDGGSTWTQQTLACPWPTCPLRLFAVAMIDNQTGWIGGEGLFHTTDGGENWLPQEIEFPGDIHAVQFLDGENGWMAGDSGALRQTSNGGVSWDAVETGEWSTLNGVYFINPERGWIVGDYGVILEVGS